MKNDKYVILCQEKLVVNVLIYCKAQRVQVKNILSNFVVNAEFRNDEKIDLQITGIDSNVWFVLGTGSTAGYF